MHLLEPGELVTTNLPYGSITANTSAVIAVDGDARDRRGMAYSDEPLRLCKGLYCPSYVDCRKGNITPGSVERNRVALLGFVADFES